MICGWNGGGGEAKTSKEAQAGGVLGPFTSLPLPNLQISPLGVVPKKVPGEFRLIHHLSYPSEGSVNDSMPQELCSVTYASLDDVIRILWSCGLEALMTKTDIESAFRLLPIHPDDFCLLGFKFEGWFYLDRALPIGLSISCRVFEQFSSMLDWATRWCAGLSSTEHYLDDFLLIGWASTDQCTCLLRVFESMCHELGLPLAHAKTERPTTKLTFLGIDLDLVAACSRLPKAKLHELAELLKCGLSASRLTLRELQVLLGHLNFVCRVVAPGRVFL